MSQNLVDFSGDPSGDELLDDLLTPQQENFLTSHSGTSRPSYAQEGTEWLDKTSTPWILKRFDGSDDIIVGYINATTNTYLPAGLILDKVDATTAPTINDDDADGYTVGSKWVDVTNDRAYIAVDVSTGAAVWKEISGSLTGPGTSSVDNEMALFSGTTGRVIKRATGTGYVKVVSGVMQTPAATIPLTDLANQAANSVLANATGSSAPPTAVTLAASKLFGRGSSGNVGEISLGTNISMSGTTLNVGGSVSDRQTFNSSGTWNKPSGFDSTCMVMIECWGAGGGGGGSGGGGTGGASSLGSHCTAYGGAGGSSGTPGAGGTPTAAGSGRTNDASLDTSANSFGEGQGGSTSGGSNNSNGRPSMGFVGGGGGCGNGGQVGAGGKAYYGGGGGGTGGGGGGSSVFGGAGGASQTNGTQPGGGGGGGPGGHAYSAGGGGAYNRVFKPLSSLGSSESVTVGSGGSAGSGTAGGAGTGGAGRVIVTVFG